jgi:hypothetical protein
VPVMRFHDLPWRIGFARRLGRNLRDEFPRVKKPQPRAAAIVLYQMAGDVVLPGGARPIHARANDKHTDLLCGLTEGLRAWESTKSSRRAQETCSDSNERKMSNSGLAHEGWARPFHLRIDILVAVELTLAKPPMLGAGDARNSRN